MSVLRFLFLPTGRLNRAKYWLGALLSGVIILVGSTLFAYAYLASLLGEDSTAVQLIVVPIFLLDFWVAIAITAKRLHDMDASAWWFLPIWLLSSALSVPRMPTLNAIGMLVGISTTLILGGVEGTIGPNRFGPDPLKREVGSPSP